MLKGHKSCVGGLVILLAIWVIPVGAEKNTDLKEKDKQNQQKVVEGNTEFMLDLYGRLRQENKGKNLFFSPYSISTALALTYSGARGQTEEQMAEVLHFLLEQEDLHKAFSQLQKKLNEGGRNGDYKLHVANALWGQEGYDFLEKFLDVTKKYYGSELQQVDFIRAREEARRIINTWVEGKTNNKIKDLIKPGVLTELTRLVLTNAIYFKGDWDLQFEEKYTKKLPFYVTGDKQVKAPLMYQDSEFQYAEVPGMQILELPYKGKQLSMVVFLPREVNGLGKLENELTTKKLKEYIETLQTWEVRVYLPKFKMTSQFSLKQVLQALGMKDAFSAKADFSGMNGRMDLFISAVVHKAFIEVNEEGTEAAAATAVVMEAGAAPASPPPVFRADHPFLFLIRDNETGSILFLGRLLNPV